MKRPNGVGLPACRRRLQAQLPKGGSMNAGRRAESESNRPEYLILFTRGQGWLRLGLSQCIALPTIGR